jgi:hypothetical protein
MRYCRNIRPFGIIANPLRALAAGIALAIGLTGGFAKAERPCYCPPACPPAAGVAPGYSPGYGTAPAPNKGGATAEGTAPPGAFGEQLAAAPSLELGEAAPAQTGENVAMSAPNFIGDFFGGAVNSGGTMTVGNMFIGAAFPLGQPIDTTLPLTGSSSAFTASDSSAQQAVILDPTNVIITPTVVNLGSGGASFTTAISSADMLTLLQGNPNATIPIVDNTKYHAIANTQFQQQTGQQGTTNFVHSVTVPVGSPFASGGGTLDSSAKLFSGSGAPGSSATFNYGYLYQYDVALNLPSPGSGGLVGIQKLVENSSPIPRDRLFFNYSMFQNVGFTPSGIDVNRFVFGFEKTFLNQMCSFELRAPFASTLSSDQVSGRTGATNTEFGNLTMYGKVLLSSGQNYAVGGGLGVAVPTADNINVSDPNGNSIVQLQNRTVSILPYLGGVYTPNSQLYTQAILQLYTPTSGNPALVNAGNGLTQVGNLNDPNWIFASFNAGYWVYRTAPTERLSGIAPQIELHYNKTLNTTDGINAGAFHLGSSLNNIEMINMVAACNFEMYGRSYVSVAYVAPVTGGPDRFFDGEWRILCNRLWW